MSDKSYPNSNSLEQPSNSGFKEFFMQIFPFKIKRSPIGNSADSEKQNDSNANIQHDVFNPRSLPKKPVRSIIETNLFFEKFEKRIVILTLASCVILIITLPIISHYISLEKEAKKQNLILKEESASTNWIDPDKSLAQGLIQKPLEILEVNFYYDESAPQQLRIESIFKKIGYYPENLGEVSDYRLSLTKDDIVLNDTYFDVPNTFYPPPPVPGESKETLDKQGSINFSLTMPWNETADKLKLFGINGELIVSVSTSAIESVSNKQNFKSIKGGVDNNKLSQKYQNSLSILRKSVLSAASGYLDITFVGEGYKESELGKFHTNVEKMKNSLLTYEPFKTRASQIVFHYVDNTESLKCSYFGRTIICDNAKVKNAVNNAAAPYDIIAVVVNNDNFGGSGGNLIVAYNGKKYANEVFVHELGHSFAHLADEYLANYPYADADINCYKGSPPNSSWSGLVDLNDYHQGCNFADSFRSSDNSIMRSVTAKYFNKVSQYWINYYIDKYAGKYSDQK